jgi:hypothetical protein
MGSWTAMSIEIEERFWEAVELVGQGEVESLRQLLVENPSLVSYRPVANTEGYFANPTLLHFVAENPIRTDQLPANIANVIRLIVGEGADVNAVCGVAQDTTTLGLVVTGRVPREMGLTEIMVETLVELGAELAGATDAAIGHKEVDALFALLRNGALVDLVVASALGWTGEIVRQWSDSPETQQRALSAAAIHGRATSLAILLERGVDPNQFNPPGFHAHSVPLHQAVASQNMAAIRMLVEGGAKVSIKDRIFGGTPVEWAWQGGLDEIAQYLESVA